MSYIATYSRSKVRLRQKDKFDEVLSQSQTVQDTSPGLAKKFDILKSKLQGLKAAVDQDVDDVSKEEEEDESSISGLISYSSGPSQTSKATTDFDTSTGFTLTATTSTSASNVERGSIETPRDAYHCERNDFLSLSFEEVCDDDPFSNKKDDEVQQPIKQVESKTGKKKRQPSNSTLLDSSKALPVHKVWQQNISPISKGQHLQETAARTEITPAQGMTLHHDGRAPMKKKRLCVSWAVEDPEDSECSTVNSKQEKTLNLKRPTSTPNQSKAGGPHFSAIISPVKNSSVFGAHESRLVNSEEIHVTLPSDLEAKSVSYRSICQIKTSKKNASNSSFEKKIKKLTSTPFNEKDVNLQFSTDLSSVHCSLRNDKSDVTVKGFDESHRETSSSVKRTGGELISENVQNMTESDLTKNSSKSKKSHSSITSMVPKLKKFTSTPYGRTMSMLQFSANISSVHDVCAENNNRDDCQENLTPLKHSDKDDVHSTNVSIPKLQESFTKYNSRHSTAHHICSELRKGNLDTDDHQEINNSSLEEPRLMDEEEIQVPPPVLEPEFEIADVEIPPVPEMTSDEETTKIAPPKKSAEISKTPQRKTPGSKRRKSVTRFRKKSNSFTQVQPITKIDFKNLPKCPIEALGHQHTKQKPSRIWLTTKKLKKFNITIPLDPFFQ